MKVLLLSIIIILSMVNNLLAFSIILETKIYKDDVENVRIACQNVTADNCGVVVRMLLPIIASAGIGLLTAAVGLTGLHPKFISGDRDGNNGKPLAVEEGKP